MPQGQEVQTVLVSAAANGSLPAEGARFQLGHKVGATAVVKASAALASFTIEGRISPEAPWVTLVAADASLAGGAGQLLKAIPNMLPDVRLTFSGNAGTVTFWVLA